MSKQFSMYINFFLSVHRLRNTLKHSDYLANWSPREYLHL